MQGFSGAGQSLPDLRSTSRPRKLGLQTRWGSFEFRWHSLRAQCEATDSDSLFMPRPRQN